MKIQRPASLAGKEGIVLQASASNIRSPAYQRIVCSEKNCSEKNQPHGLRRRTIKSSVKTLSLFLLPLLLATPVIADSYNPAAHTDPINLTPQVREAHDHFYNLDYDGALARFEAIQRDNPQSAIATGYVLMTVVFRELFSQDLHAATYYAHDSFLSSKRNVPVPADI